MSTKRDRTKLRPAEIAQQRGVSEETVIGWIRAEELRAINAANRRGLRKPRRLVDVANLEHFEQSRLIHPDPPTSRPKRQKPDPSVIEFV